MTKRQDRRRSALLSRTAALARYAARELQIQFRFKGKLYVAQVRRDGTIVFTRESAEWSRLKDKVFTTPSAAGTAVAGNPVNGYRDWRFLNSEGKWVRLRELRTRKVR